MGRQTLGMWLNAIAVSRDGKWVVCGFVGGANVWDAELQKRVAKVESANVVEAVDVSPESTRFATAASSKASIWNITTGKKLVGPLAHDAPVNGIKFSPDGRHIATACQDSIRIFDSYNGDQLIIIDNPMPGKMAITPIVWPSDGRRVFAISKGGKIKSFDASTRSQLAEWEAASDSGDVESIAMSTNNRFIASSAGHSISFWDTSTHTRLGSVLEDVDRIRSIALSPDGIHLATGGENKTVTIWNLSEILPESYLPIAVSTPFPMSWPLITFICRFTLL